MIITSNKQIEETASYVAGSNSSLFIFISSSLSIYLFYLFPLLSIDSLIDSFNVQLGGLWEPYCYGQTLEEKMLRWSEYTYQLYQRLYFSTEASISGIQQLSVYNFSEEFEVSLFL